MNTKILYMNSLLDGRMTTIGLYCINWCVVMNYCKRYYIERMNTKQNGKITKKNNKIKPLPKCAHFIYTLSHIETHTHTNTHTKSHQQLRYIHLYIYWYHKYVEQQFHNARMSNTKLIKIIWLLQYLYTYTYISHPKPKSICCGLQILQMTNNLITNYILFIITRAHPHIN